MVDSQLIRPGMTVLCADDRVCGRVDNVVQDVVQLAKDNVGRHHWIPVDWCDRVEGGEVHLRLALADVEAEWSDTAPVPKPQIQPRF